jgi:hypothetical protein
MQKIVLTLVSLFVLLGSTKAQVQDSITITNQGLDSIYISEYESRKGPLKILHAEPLYIDLIRDLGALKGEKEWNVGFGLTDNNNYDKYSALVEYEFAPIDRLGLEIELPFSFYLPTGTERDLTPANKLNSLKLAAQYTFLVSDKMKTSMALGYINEFDFVEFNRYGRGNRIVNGNVYNPFFVAAKRWGRNFHALIYTGPVIEQEFQSKAIHSLWQINSNINYMITGTRNFVGIEINQEVTKENTYTTLRPQMRLGIADNLLVGIVTGIPLQKRNERISSFIRLIYEPGHKDKPHRFS